MWKNWTDCQIDWTNDSSTAFGSNWMRIPSEMATHDFTPRLEPRPVYRNGQRLKKNQQRPEPFWLVLVDVLLPIWDVIICKQIFRRLVRGAYSRKYDKPRKFRKMRLF